MSNLNRVCLMGRLVKDAEMRFTTEGKSVSNFTISVNGFNQEDVSFFDIVLWNSESRQQYLTKGTFLSIDGYLKQEFRKNSEGQNRSRVVVIVQNLYLLRKNPENIN